MATATKPKIQRPPVAMPDASVAPAVPGPLIGEPLAAEFLTEPNSPFPDGYSIAKERAFLAKDIEAGLAEKESGRLYDRYIELLDREDRLESMRRRYEDKMGADHETTAEEVTGMRQIGRLVDEEVDQLQVHTLEAYRLFLGRRREPGTEAAPIIGGKKMGSVLRSLWLMTGRDNPYADWALVRQEHAMREVQGRLKREIDAAQAILDKQQRRGLSLSIVRSENPMVLNLGFRSPYGYGVVHMVSEYDWFIRLMKTMERKSLRTDDEVRKAVSEMNRLIRRIWNETSRFDRWLGQEEIKDLCRSDFAEGVPEDASKRAQFAVEVFGPVPADVFTCAIKPTHSRRHLRVSPEERKFLAHMGRQLAKAEAAAADGDADAHSAAGAAGTAGADAADRASPQH